jgi:hypothetical protein
MSHRIALIVIAALIGLATAPAAAAENHLSDPSLIPWRVVTNSFSG